MSQSIHIRTMWAHHQRSLDHWRTPKVGDVEMPWCLHGGTFLLQFCNLWGPADWLLASSSFRSKTIECLPFYSFFLGLTFGASWKGGPPKILYRSAIWDPRGGHRVATGLDPFDAFLDGVIIFKAPKARVLCVAHVVAAHACVWESHADPRLSLVNQNPNGWMRKVIEIWGKKKKLK